MRHRPNDSLVHLIAAAALSGVVLAFVLVMGWAAATDTGALLFTTAHGLGAVMLVLALSGLIGCAAFGTGLVLDEGSGSGGLPSHRLARNALRSRTSRMRRGPHG